MGVYGDSFEEGLRGYAMGFCIRNSSNGPLVGELNPEILTYLVYTTYMHTLNRNFRLYTTTETLNPGG